MRTMPCAGQISMPVRAAAALCLFVWHAWLAPVTCEAFGSPGFYKKKLKKQCRTHTEIWVNLARVVPERQAVGMRVPCFPAAMAISTRSWEYLKVTTQDSPGDAVFEGRPLNHLNPPKPLPKPPPKHPKPLKPP